MAIKLALCVYTTFGHNAKYSADLSGQGLQQFSET